MTASMLLILLSFATTRRGRPSARSSFKTAPLPALRSTRTLALQLIGALASLCESPVRYGLARHVTRRSICGEACNCCGDRSAMWW
ncbi:hypothetical protein F4678DRAFT_453348 [Xylaria arbuscula]|nr:hypothetical protein F4678DRAFT_453348 [Xylaria arbuscula]